MWFYGTSIVLRWSRSLSGVLDCLLTSILRALLAWVTTAAEPRCRREQVPVNPASPPGLAIWPSAPSDCYRTPVCHLQDSAFGLFCTAPDRIERDRGLSDLSRVDWQLRVALRIKLKTGCCRIRPSVHPSISVAPVSHAPFYIPFLSSLAFPWTCTTSLALLSTHTLDIFISCLFPYPPLPSTFCSASLPIAR